MLYKNTEIKPSQSNLYERVKRLLISDEWSDCCFSVSGKDFKAHKLILGISSPVFEAMFYGPLSTDKKVVITDIEPEVFQLILNYIYTDKVDIHSIEEAFELLYASRKYILEHLSNTCIAYIQENISSDNVIEVLNYPEYLHDKQLKSFALKLFCEHASYLIEENKDIISSSCMRAILESDHINIGEAELIKHVLDWTKHYCKQSEINESFDNRRDVLMKNGLFELLRFNLLSPVEFMAVKEYASDILLPREIENIRMIVEGKPALNKFVFKPRHPLKSQWHLCSRNRLKSVAPLNIGPLNSTVHSRIKANKSVFITSLCVPTRMAPALVFHNNVPKNYYEQISVSIISESDNRILKFTNFMNTAQYNFYIDIELSEPCLIKKNKWYNISFMWPQNRFPTFSYVMELRDQVVHNGNKISFEFDDLCTVTGGNFLIGFKYCL